MPDPYLDPRIGVLRDKLDITDPDELLQVEGRRRRRPMMAADLPTTPPFLGRDHPDLQRDVIPAGSIITLRGGGVDVEAADCALAGCDHDLAFIVAP